MKKPDRVVTFRGRFLGIGVLTAIQVINGLTHTFFGLVLVLGTFISVAASSNFPSVFSFYTLIYGILTLLFTYLLWKGKSLGWIGTVAVALFVIIADSLTVLDMLTFLGIIKTAAIVEIPYSLATVLYLIQTHIRTKYGI
ncbi:MAG: hypothetical protein JW815_04095 [Candidatus Bathyarchaeota archaeon]|nr:hypothetical protein [Candidatus Bathyarchaeum sp.]